MGGAEEAVVRREYSTDVTNAEGYVGSIWGQLWSEEKVGDFNLLVY